MLATVVLWQWEWWREQIPDEVSASSPLLVGPAHRPGQVAASCPTRSSSAAWTSRPGPRRRSPGGVALALLDQGDLVLGIWVCLLPIWVMPVWLAAVAFVAVAAVHAVLNVVGYAIGARAAPV